MSSIYWKPGKIYSPTQGILTDACFTADRSQYCTHFSPDPENPDSGDPVCTEGGAAPRNGSLQSLQASGALVECMQGTVGCSSLPSWYCKGTAVPCASQTDKACPGECAPTGGYMQCPPPN